MPNYFVMNRYPRYVISGFADALTNIQRPRQTGQVNVSLPGLAAGHVDLLYRFVSSTERVVSALGFQRLPSKRGEVEHVYSLVYIAPSLLEQWREAMDRVVEEYSYSDASWTAFDIQAMGNLLRPTEQHGEWVWAFYLRALVYARDHSIERLQDIGYEKWLIFANTADQDVASLPEATQHPREIHTQPVLVPLTEEMQDAFDAYCALDVNNRNVPAWVEAIARLRLWKANHPHWFNNIFERNEHQPFC